MDETPKHIAIILDGNRRFAQNMALAPWKGHEFGAKKVEQLLMWGKELGLRELTLYCFAIDNFKRPTEEFTHILEIFRNEFSRLKDDERIMKEGIRIRVIGRSELFPGDILQSIREIEEKTKNNHKYQVNLALAYDGRTEITDAVKRLIADVQAGNVETSSITEKKFAEYLYLNSDPDCIIRTGGEKRISNFLLWQAGYAELIFIDKFWPEFEKEDLKKCIDEFGRRKRRFGK